MEDAAHDGEADIDELVSAAKARLTVLHRLDEAKLWGAPDRKLDRLAAGLFYDASRAAGARLDARAERLSVAATRLAFCASPATARWLAQQEAALFASRLRLGEREVPDPSPSEEDDDDAAPGANPNEEARLSGAVAETRGETEERSNGEEASFTSGTTRHRWVAFERAAGLIARREPGVAVRNGRARVPDRLINEVLVFDHRRETEAALAATARRRRHAEAEARGAGAFGTPAAEDALAKLVTWRPNRPTTEENAAWARAEREASRAARRGAEGQRAPATDDLEDLISVGPSGHFFGNDTESAANGAGREGRARTGWCRGWRRRREDGGGAAATSLSLFPDAGRAFGGADSAFGRLPVERFAPPLGSDAKRALRVIRKGPRHAVAGARPFPLCVKRHLAGLHRDHHLRHEARFQLTLFFKGIDLSAEETLHVWRSQFLHGKMSDFQNEHRYHVRHAYGLEGKMADYPPFTCDKLARRKVEPNGAASCPFAAAATALRAEAGRLNPASSVPSSDNDPARLLREEIGALVPPLDAERIARVAAGGNAKEACRLFFRASHFPNGEPNSDADANANANVADVSHDVSRSSPTAALRRLYQFEDLKFPHDYYDQSARVEEESKKTRFAGGGFPGEEIGKSARRRVALEMEDDTDESDAEEGGDLPGYRDH